MNKQIEAALQKLLATSGPIAALISNKLGWDATTTGLAMELALAILTPLAAVAWGWWTNRQTALVASVASMSAVDQRAALNKVSDSAKVEIAEGVPGVATVVVNNDATGKLAAMAASPDHPNVVTASQNQSDAMGGDPKPSNTGD